MLAYTDTIDASLDALATFTDRIRDSRDRLGTQTRLAGWDVAALANHVAAVAWQQGEAFHRARMQIAEQPNFVEVKVPDHLDAIERATAHLRSGIDQLDATGDPIVPLPFAALPASFAAAVLLIEYGVHLNDLEHALGESTELRAPVADAVVELLGAFLPGLAASGPDGPASIALRAESRAPTCVVWRDGAWQSAANESSAQCTIDGSPSAIALFSLGRIPSDDPSLRVAGDLALATAFKRFFPGP